MHFIFVDLSVFVPISGMPNTDGSIIDVIECDNGTNLSMCSIDTTDAPPCLDTSNQSYLYIACYKRELFEGVFLIVEYHYCICNHDNCNE